MQLCWLGKSVSVALYPPIGDLVWTATGGASWMDHHQHMVRFRNTIRLDDCPPSALNCMSMPKFRKCAHGLQHALSIPTNALPHDVIAPAMLACDMMHVQAMHGAVMLGTRRVSVLQVGPSGKTWSTTPPCHDAECISVPARCAACLLVLSHCQNCCWSSCRQFARHSRIR